MDAQLVQKYATASGLLGCAWWAGATASISIFTVPALIEAGGDTTQSLKAWSAMYQRGAAVGPKVGLTTCILMAYSAYERASRGVAWAPPAIAGLLSLSIVPYTLGLMMPTNRALTTGASATEKAKAMPWDEARVLLERWQRLNFVRGLLPLAGALVLLWDVFTY